MPLDTFYLPKESPSLVNFPILRDQRSNIEALMTYAIRVSSAVTDYNEGRYDKIDLNVDELENHIRLCRETCEALGTAKSVPFDVLIELRKYQEEFQNILQLYKVHGNALIGRPSISSEGSGV